VQFPVEQIVELMVPMCCTKCEEKVMETLLEMEGEIFCSVASSDELNGLYAGSIAIAILLVFMHKCLNLIEEKLLIVVSTSPEE
jgi:hypothetical protein